MQRRFLYIVIGVIMLVVISIIGYFMLRMPMWKASAINIKTILTTEEITPESLYRAKQEADKLPAIYPLTRISPLLDSTYELLQTRKTLPPFPTNIVGKPIKYTTIDAYRSYYNNGIEVLDDALDVLYYAPNSLFSSTDKELEYANIERFKSFINYIWDVYDSLKDDNERVIILFQNNNEIRPNGGFSGSYATIDFAEDYVVVYFDDMYAYDRRVLESSKEPAPAYFKAFEPLISLRDSNIKHDIDDNLKDFQRYYKAMGERIPTTLIAFDTEIIEVLMKQFKSPFRLDPWGIMLLPDNTDFYLQYLIEAKVGGRHGTKQPLLDLIEQLTNVGMKDIKNTLLMLPDTLLRLQKTQHIHATSTDRTTQNILYKLGFNNKKIDDISTYDFLQLAFTSVSGNKSDRFMKTSIVHETRINNDNIENTVIITRTHTLKNNDVERLLKISNMMPNLRMLYNDTMKYVLGEGQNRVYVRLMIPLKSTLDYAFTPSGQGYIDTTNDDYIALDVPIFTSMNETTSAEIRYTVPYKNASKAYEFTYLAPNGMKNSTFTKTVLEDDMHKYSSIEGILGTPQNASEDMLWRIKPLDSTIK